LQSFCARRWVAATARSAAETKPAAPAAAQPATPPLPPAPDPPGEQAYAHFDAAAQASRAILSGDLQAAIPHLAWLGHYQYPDKLPVAWRPHATRMQLAARVLVRAATVGEALRGLPSLDAACGSCHAAIADVDFNATEGAVMHSDGALALLDGLSGEADAVYLSALRATPRIADKKVDKKAHAALKDACARAKRVATWVDRLTATEEIFGMCGSCHEKYR